MFLGVKRKHRIGVRKHHDAALGATIDDMATASIQEARS